MIVLVAGDHSTTLATIGPEVRCDLKLVDDILRLRLTATRLGWSLRLTDVEEPLRELMELVGLGDCVER